MAPSACRGGARVRRSEAGVGAKAKELSTRPREAWILEGPLGGCVGRAAQVEGAKKKKVIICPAGQCVTGIFGAVLMMTHGGKLSMAATPQHQHGCRDWGHVHIEADQPAATAWP